MLTNVKGKNFRETVRVGVMRDETGTVTKAKKEYSRERLEEDISICLNCKKEKCTGSCAAIMDSRRQLSNERKRKRNIPTE